MNKEELELILSAITALGSQGKDAFLWWLLASKIAPIIGWLITLFGVIFMGIQIAKVIYNQSRCAKFGEEVRDLLCVGCTGYLTEGEMQDSIRKLKTLLK